MNSSCSSSSSAKTSSLISAMICRCRSNEKPKVFPSKMAVTSEIAARYCVSKVSSCNHRTRMKTRLMARLDEHASGLYCMATETSSSHTVLPEFARALPSHARTHIRCCPAAALVASTRRRGSGGGAHQDQGKIELLHQTQGGCAG